MVRIVLLCGVLMMAVVAQAGQVYDTRRLSEAEMLRMYESTMRDACRYSLKFWHQWSANTKAGYWGDGASEGNEGIRAIGNEVLTSAALLKYCKGLSADERRGLLQNAQSALRYVVASHVTGTAKSVDGKQWGKSWQSGMWMGNLGFGAWLMWDELDPGLRKDVERVVVSEADRLLDVRPPTNRWGDTKAEENAWDNLALAVAASMFPKHAHAASWREKSIEYMMNTLCVPRDLKDSTLVDGRPVSEWVHGVNLNPDFTLENHNILHPSYLACSSYMLGEAVMMYTYGRQVVPEAATRHLIDLWDMYQTIIFPWGQYACPQGMDWDLHGTPVINLQALLATYKQDATAAAMEQSNLQYMRAWQRWASGDMNVPGGRLGFCRHSICEEQVTWAYLAHRILGPAVGYDPSTSSGWLPGGSLVRHYSSVDVLLHRTKSKLVTFSWKNRIMGTVAPAADAYPQNPYFAVPVSYGLRGTIELDPVGDQSIKLEERKCTKAANGFETTGTLITNGGRLKQTIKVTSIGEKTVVYQDRVIALEDVAIRRELGVPIGIENDSITGGKRVVFHQGSGPVTFDWKKPRPAMQLSGRWANVDSRLGIIGVAGRGLGYVQAAEYNGQAVYADVLYGSYHPAPQSYKTGDEVAWRIVILATEITPEQTAALNDSARIVDAPKGKALHFILPEGAEAQISLL